MEEVKNNGKKLKSWRVYEEFINSYPEFEKMMNWIPKENAENGAWLNYK